MATCCAPSGSSAAQRAPDAQHLAAQVHRGKALRQRLGQEGRPALEQRAQLGHPVLLALLPGLGPRVATAQQRQRLVAHRGPQPGELARRIARQDQAERQQREDRRQHPGRRVVQERRQAVAHGIAGRRQRIEGHQVGQPANAVAGAPVAWTPGSQNAASTRTSKGNPSISGNTPKAQKAAAGTAHKVPRTGARAGDRVGRGCQQRAIGRQYQQHHVTVGPARAQPKQASQHDGQHGTQAIAQRPAVVAVKTDRHDAAACACRRSRQGLQSRQRFQVGVDLLEQPVGADQQGGFRLGVRQLYRRRRRRAAPRASSRMRRAANAPPRLRPAHGRPRSRLAPAVPAASPGLAAAPGGRVSPAPTSAPNKAVIPLRTARRARAPAHRIRPCPGQQVVDPVDLAHQPLANALAVWRRNGARHPRGQAGIRRLQPGAQAAPAQQRDDQRQAGHAHGHGGAARHHMFEGALGMAHRAVSGQADGIAGHHHAGRAKMAQHRHARHAQAQPGTEAQDEQQRHLSGRRHQREGGQHADQRADEAPHALPITAPWLRLITSSTVDAAE